MPFAQYEHALLDVYSTYLKNVLNDQFFSLFFQVKKVLKGVKVETTHQGGIRRYRISGLSPRPVSELMYVTNLGTVT